MFFHAYLVIVQFLLSAISRSACVSCAAPKFPAIVIVCAVLLVRSANPLKIATKADLESLQSV